MLNRLRLLSLIVGPVLLAVSTFFWSDGRYGVTGGLLVAAAAVAWSYGMLGAWEVVADRMPAFGAVGILATLAGVLGGTTFGLQGLFEAIYEVSPERSLAEIAAHPVAEFLVYWIAGPAAPLAFALLGIATWIAQVCPRWISVLLVLGGLAFPASRITRAEFVAHGADLLLLVGLVALGTYLFWDRQGSVSPVQRSAAGRVR